MTITSRDRLVVLVGNEASVPPSSVVTAARDVTDIHFMIDTRAENASDLLAVAGDLAPTTCTDFSDLSACLEAARGVAAAGAMTFTDMLCPVAEWLDGQLRDAPPARILWGHKDEQRRLLREAGLSRVRSARVDSSESLYRFVEAVGFPVMVKPIDGAASADAWRLDGEPDLDRFLGQARFDDPGAGRQMFAEEFITGEPIPPYRADYVSVEVFRSGRPGPGDSDAGAFVTDRLPVAWPCRETGLALPTSLTADRQRLAVETAKQALDVLGAQRGAFHVEMKPRPAQPEIIEVNGRLGGFIARLVKFGTGVDLASQALLCAAGRAREFELRWDKCALVYLFQPPPAARRIVRAPSLREVSRRAGVVGIDRVEPVGTQLDWRKGTNRSPASIWLAADNHADLHQRLVEMALFLTEEYEFADENGLPVQDDSWIEQITAKPRTGVAR